MISHPRLTIRDLRVRPVNVPMRLPLQTSGGTVGIAPLALIDLLTEEGVTGSTYLFCYTPLALRPVVQVIENLTPFLTGDPVAPFEIERKLQRQFRLLGAKGIVGMALAGIDMAAWDALAQARRHAARAPAGRCAARHPRLQQLRPGDHRPRARRRRGGAAGAPGFSAIKVRLGYADATADVEVVRAVRARDRRRRPPHVRLQPGPLRARGDRAHPGAGGRGPVLGRGADARRRLRGPRADPRAGRGCPSRWARTGGGRTRWRSAWRPAPPTSACRTP